jgi:hypothetical protein
VPTATTNLVLAAGSAPLWITAGSSCWPSSSASLSTARGGAARAVAQAMIPEDLSRRKPACHGPWPRDPVGARPLARLLAVEAATLAIFSALHLTGTLQAGAESGADLGAGIPEALICAALFYGSFALVRAPTPGWSTALLSIGFAIFGFIVGLTFTVRGGPAVDVAYHAVMLPLLVTTALLLRRAQRR